jgi:uncharacterized membrane protein
MLSDEDSRGPKEDKGLDRILALSDGIFAFAITLLVLNLTVPDLGSTTTTSLLLSALGNDLNRFVAYGESFAIISIYWVVHHRIFRYIRRYDNLLMYLNLLFLLFITILPFFTELISQYGDLQISAVLYFLTQASGGFTLAFIWHHASNNSLLIDKVLSAKRIKVVRLRVLTTPIVFLGAIAVTFVTPSLSYFSLFAIFPIMSLISRKYKEKGNLEN